MPPLTSQRHGTVFDIQRFALHDGPGIRTTVFLKGCPLRCRWCHNPESWLRRPQLSYRPALCRPEDRCASCPGGDMDSDGRRRLERALARGGFAGCDHGALRVIGREMAVEEVLEQVLRDADYYRRSGGGLTLSGGEPLQQAGFCSALLGAVREHDVHTVLDTTGWAPWAAIDALADDVNLFLWDHKAGDAVEHRRLTGVDSSRILDNLERLYRRGARIVLRCPLVPGVNDTPADLAAIAALSARYPELEGIEVMAYHDWGVGKAARVGLELPLAALPSADEPTRERWLAQLHRLGCTRAALG